MQKTFTEFSTEAQFSISNDVIFDHFTKSKQLGLYTFIWAQDDEVALIVDGVPITLQPQQIISLTPIQYLKYVSWGERNCISI